MKTIAATAAWMLAAAIVLAGCSESTTQSGTGGASGQGEGGAGAGGGSADGGGGAGTGAGGAMPDATCMQLCSHPGYSCTGVDLESGSGTTSAITDTGCTFTAMLPVSGTLVMTLDCVAGEACVTASDGGCAGNTGECYAITADSEFFSYMVENCIQGSLSCSKLSP